MMGEQGAKSAEDTKEHEGKNMTNTIENDGRLSFGNWLWELLHPRYLRPRVAGEIEKLKLGPDDVLVVKIKHNLGDKAFEQMTDGIRRWSEKRKLRPGSILVITDDVELRVISSPPENQVIGVTSADHGKTHYKSI